MTSKASTSTAKEVKEKTKLVIRKLPPTLSEESFLSAINKYIEDKYNWFAYCPGKVSARKVVFSRAYINLKEAEDVFDFKAKFDGHVFVSNKGNQYKCSVEYAPFQKVPKQQGKKNPNEGTIEKDADYQAFLLQLEQGPEALPSAVAQLEKKEAEAAKAGPADGTSVIVTPLMQYLQEKYSKNPGLRLGSGRTRKKGGKDIEIVPEIKKRPAGSGRRGGDDAAAATSRGSRGVGKKEQQQALAAAEAALRPPTSRKGQQGGEKDHKDREGGGRGGHGHERGTSKKDAHDAAAAAEKDGEAHKARRQQHGKGKGEKSGQQGTAQQPQETPALVMKVLQKPRPNTASHAQAQAPAAAPGPAAAAAGSSSASAKGSHTSAHAKQAAAEPSTAIPGRGGHSRQGQGASRPARPSSTATAATAAASSSDVAGRSGAAAAAAEAAAAAVAALSIGRTAASAGGDAAGGKPGRRVRAGYQMYVPRVAGARGAGEGTSGGGADADAGNG